MHADLARTWTIRELALRVGLNEKKLKAGFRALFGSSIRKHLQDARLDRARALLETGDLSVTDASVAVGYANPSHFARLFRRVFGRLPSQCK